MSMSQTYDVGHYIKGAAALPSLTTPSSSGAALSGAIAIDRWALGRRYQSCKAVVTGHFVGSTQQVATIAMAFQHSSDGSSWDNFSTQTNNSKTLGTTGATGAQTVDDVAEQNVDLRGARRYVRVAPTASFGLTTSGDSLVATGVLIFGGGDENPAI